MRKEFCLCAEIKAAANELLDVKTRILVLMHHREEKLPTNTARLAHLMLPKCEIRLRGQKENKLDLSDLENSPQNTFLLFPSDSSVILDQTFMKKQKLHGPITLVVPDGSWRQASKVAKREAEIKNLTKVMLPLGASTQYQLRHEPKEGGLATFEAMARCLGVIEGNVVEEKMMEVFLLMVKRTLLSRRGILQDI